MKKQKMSKEAKAMIKKVGNQINHQFDFQKGEEEMNEENIETMEGEVVANKKGATMKKGLIAVGAAAGIGAIVYGIYKIVTGTFSDETGDDTTMEFVESTESAE